MSDKNRDSQRSLFKYMKSRALAYEAEISSQLISYRKNQSYYSQREFTASRMEELIQSIHNSHVSYLGDFHTYDQNSRNLVRIIKTFLKNKSKFAIGIEMVHESNQSYLNAYLKGFLTELEFLESINYSESWRFPWNHYQILFNYAKENDIPMIALNSIGSLEDRDQRAAETIAAFMDLHPSTPMLVLFGELHINANKLPRKLKECSTIKKLRQTIIHQNLDDSYWKIIDNNQNIQDFKIIKFNQHEFCLFSSPPWMKYESMCYWYENLLGDPDFDIHEYIIENGLKLFTGNTFENFQLIVQQAGQFLGYSETEELSESFNIYDHSNIDFVEGKIEEIKSKRVREFYEYKIKHNKSFHLNGSSLIYCSNYSVNRLARLAGSFIYQSFLAEDVSNDEIESMSKSDFFVYLVLNSMYSYFCAKSLNPFLKCDMYLDLELKARKEKKSTNKKIYEEAVYFFKNIKNSKKQLVKINLEIMYEISFLIGDIFGEILFNDVEEQKNSDYPYFLLSKENLNFNHFQKFVESKILKNNLFKMRRKRFF